MKRKFKIPYLKIAIVVMLMISFVSATYAWFSYSNFTDISATVNVRAWSVDFKDGEDIITNNIIISASEIYPGMETIIEEIDITNNGDVDARLTENILAARILNINNYEPDETIGLTSAKIEDNLAHNYPFKINISTTNELVTAKGGTSKLIVTISWPLETGADEIDSYWGSEAYKFAAAENNKLNADPSYEIKPPIEISIKVNAIQETEDDSALDKNFQLGQLILFDVVNNTGCTSLSSTCLLTNVIEVNNTVGDNTVSLLPNIENPYMSSDFNNYNATLATVTAGYNVPTRALTVEDVVHPISLDIVNSYIKNPSYSDIIIGNLAFENRLQTMITDTVAYGGYFNFLNPNFDYLSTTSCVWTNSEYNVGYTYALEKVTDLSSMIYGNDNNNTCKVVPVIEATKAALSTNG